MNDRGADMIYYGIFLAIIISAFAARRVPLKSSVKMALAWVGIFAVVIVIASGRERYAAWWTSARDMIDGPDQTVTGGAVSVPMSDDGHFWVTAQINGVERRMLVDSGATMTSITADTARAAGVDINESPFPLILDTANGAITARAATAKKITLGDITVTALPVAVSAKFGDTDAIGMNFLSKLKSWRVEGRTLVLQPQR